MSGYGQGWGEWEASESDLLSSWMTAYPSDQGLSPTPKGPGSDHHPELGEQSEQGALGWGGGQHPGEHVFVVECTTVCQAPTGYR